MADNVTLPFRVGELIAGKYRIDGTIGAGGMGVVLAATHLDLDRKVAVKLIRPELAADESIVERLLLEAKAAAKIRSRHVGTVLDVGRLDSSSGQAGAPYIVMEYLEGEDLGALLHRCGRLSALETTDLVMQACEALAEAHQASIVHRDLKPENLFIVTTPDGGRLLKILDFGIAKQLGDPDRRALTNPSTAVGSPQYMSPEQMQAGAVDTRADIWALGAILYEMLGGQPAFGGDTLPAVCAKVLGAQPDPLHQHLPDIAPRLEALVMRCLSKDPNKRFASIAELAAELHPFGSAAAHASFRRVYAIATGSSVLPSGGQSSLGTTATTGPTLLADAGSAVNPAAGAATGPTEAGKSTVKAVSMIAETSSPKKGSPLSFVVAIGAVLVVGGGAAFWVTMQERDAARADDSAAPDPSVAAAEPTPPPAATDATGTAAQPTDETANADQPSPPDGETPAAADAGAANAAPRGRPTTGAAATGAEAPVDSTPQPRATPRPRPSPKPRPKPSEPAPGGNAWDPGNFGGRH